MVTREWWLLFDLPTCSVMVTVAHLVIDNPSFFYISLWAINLKKWRIYRDGPHSAHRKHTSTRSMTSGGPTNPNYQHACSPADKHAHLMLMSTVRRHLLRVSAAVAGVLCGTMHGLSWTTYGYECFFHGYQRERGSPCSKRWNELRSPSMSGVHTI